MKRRNPWTELFRGDRAPFHGGLWRYLKENLDCPYYMLRERMAPAEADSIANLKYGEGKIIRRDGEKVAAYRDAHGKATLLSPICTYLKCIARWNDTDHTWDCPCHGSRFHPTSEVLSGPAEEPLAPVKEATKRA